MAGIVFRDEAERLEQRLLGVERSTRLSRSEMIEHDPTHGFMRVPTSPDPRFETELF
jgi:hypothetical protein